MAGIGSFMEGFAQGGSMRMDWERQNRRRRKEDAEFSLLQDDVRTRNEKIKLQNEDLSPEDKIPELAMPEQGADPFLFRMLKKFKKKEDRGQKAIENAPITEAQTSSASQQEGMVSPWAASGDYFNQQQPVALNTGETVYADGGKVKAQDEVEKPTYMQALKDRTKEVLGLAPYAVKSNEGDLGKAARALEGRKNKIDRAVDGYADGGDVNRDEEDPTGVYLRRRAKAIGPRDEAYAQYHNADRALRDANTNSGRQMYGDRRMAARQALEVAQGELDAAQQQVERHPYRATSQGQGRGGARRGALPTTAPTPESAPAAAGAGGAPSGPALPRGAPSAPQLSAGPQMIDFGQVEAVPEDVPGMSTKDWERYRAKRLALAAREGVSLGDVDKEVTQMQMGGFQRYGQQALALMQAGNMRGAATAMRAAFQYFPNGNDVKLGIHQGQIIGYGMDEDTGKPVGKPMVLNVDTTARMLENFSNPQAWRMWTKDWHSMAMEEKKFERDTAVSEEQLAQGRTGLNLRAEANQIAAAAAKTRAMVALNSAVRGGLKPSDLTSTSKYFSEALAEMVGLSDPRLAVALASKAAEAWAANPGTPPATILDMVVEANADTIDSALEE